MPLTCQKYWASELRPLFFFSFRFLFFFLLPSLFPSTCCALLSLISWQELGSRHVPIREQRYCGAVLSANLRKSALCATGHVPALLAFLSSDLKRERRKRQTWDMTRGTFSSISPSKSQKKEWPLWPWEALDWNLLRHQWLINLCHKRNPITNMVKTGADSRPFHSDLPSLKRFCTSLWT